MNTVCGIPFIYLKKRTREGFFGRRQCAFERDGLRWVCVPEGTTSTEMILHLSRMGCSFPIKTLQQQGGEYVSKSSDKNILEKIHKENVFPLLWWGKRVGVHAPWTAQIALHLPPPHCGAADHVEVCDQCQQEAAGSHNVVLISPKYHAKT